MFGNKPFTPQQRPAQQGEGCKMSIRRDANGRIVGYKDNGKCSPTQLKSFTEKLENVGETEEEE